MTNPQLTSGELDSAELAQVLVVQGCSRCLEPGGMVTATIYGCCRSAPSNSEPSLAERR
jgi:hypothetical protein